METLLEEKGIGQVLMAYGMCEGGTQGKRKWLTMEGAYETLWLCKRFCLSG